MITIPLAIVLIFFEKALLTPPNDIKDQRRLIYQNTTTQKNYQGGVKISMEKNNFFTMKFFIYKEKKFSSEGWYLTHSIDLNQMNSSSSTGNTTQETKLCKFQKLGYKNCIEKIKINFSSNFSTSTDPIKYLTDLKIIKILEPDFQVKIIKIFPRNLITFYYRISFYIFSFVLVWMIFILIRDLKNYPHYSTGPLSIQMNMILCLAALIMAIINYNSITFWIWIFLIFPFSKIFRKLTKIKSELAYDIKHKRVKNASEKKIPKSSKIDLVYPIFGVLFAFGSFYSEYFFLFLILYFCFGFSIDHLRSRNRVMKLLDFKVHISWTIMYTIFVFMAIFDRGNFQFFYADFLPFFLFLFLVFCLSCFNFYLVKRKDVKKEDDGRSGNGQLEIKVNEGKL